MKINFKWIGPSMTAVVFFLSACGKPVPDIGAENSTSAKDTVAETTKRETALPKAEYFRWRDSVFSYGVSLQSELFGAADAVMLSLGVTSDMNVLRVEQLSHEDLVMLVLINPEVRIEGDSVPTAEQLGVLKLELSQPVWGRYRDGKLLKIYLPAKPSAYSVGIWRTLLAGLQVSMPVNLDEAYKTVEFDSNGEARVAYEKTGAGTWQKTKLSYAKGLHAADSESPVGGAPTPTLVSSTGSLSIEDEVLKSVRFDETIEVPLSGQGGLTGKTALNISFQKRGETSSGAKILPPSASLVLAGNEPFVQALPMDAMDFERVKGLTFEKTLRALVARSRDPRKKALWAEKNDKAADPKEKRDAEQWTEDWARYFAALPAFFRRQPETLKIAEKEIRDGNPAAASLLGGLASSGNPAAQAVLVKLTLDDKLDLEIRENAMRNLVQCTLPTKQTAEVVWKLADDSDFSRYAVFGIGIIARKMRKNGETDEAATLLKQLIEKLDKTTDPHEKRDVLRGISNTGDPAALEAVRPLFQSDNPTVRGGAVEAVRLMEIPEADTLIAERISHKTETAAGVRASAIRAASTRSHEDPILAALLDAAQNDPDRKVKKEARKLLFSWSNGDPDLTAELEAIADAEENDTDPS